MSLFGKFCDIYMYKGFSLGMTLWCSPYIINPVSKQLTVTKSKARLFMWISNNLIIFAYFLTLANRLGHYMIEQSEDKIKRMPLMVGGTALCTFTISCYFSTFLYLRELPVLIEQNKNFFREYQDDFLIATRNQKRFVAKATEDRGGVILVIMYYGSLFLAALIVVIIIRTPETPVVLTSFAPDPHSWLTKSILIPINLYVVLCGYAHAFMWGFSILPPLLSFLNVFQEMTIRRKRYSSSSTLRSEEMLIEQFRRIQILINFGNKLYCSYAIPAFIWLFLVTCVYSLYGTIINHGFTSFFLFVASSGLIFILAVFVSLLGRIFDYSTEMLRSWKGHLVTEPHKAMSRSFYPLRFTVSSYYFLDCRTVLTIIGIIFEYTVHLIITEEVAVKSSE